VPIGSIEFEAHESKRPRTIDFSSVSRDFAPAPGSAEKLRSAVRFGNSALTPHPQARRVDLAQPRAKQRGRRSRFRCDALGCWGGLDLEALKGRALDARVDRNVGEIPAANYRFGCTLHLRCVRIALSGLRTLTAIGYPGRRGLGSERPEPALPLAVLDEAFSLAGGSNRMRIPVLDENEFDPRACRTNLIRLRGNVHRISRRADQVTSSAPPRKSSSDGALLDCECNWQHGSDLRR